MTRQGRGTVLDGSAWSLPPRLAVLLLQGVAALSVVTIVSWGLVAFVHGADSYHVNHVGGAWVGLARYVNDGVLYPPLYDGHSFGGTRYMPLQFLAYAGGAEVTGDYLVGAKLVVYLTAMSLFGLIFGVLGMLGCSIVVRLGLIAAVLTSFTGFWAATAVYGDALPVLLQLAAVTVVIRFCGPSAAIGAGTLCALAILCKITAVWAPAAILLWLLLRSRSRAIVFAASLALVLLVGVGLLEVLSDGRMSENLRGLSGSGFLGFRSVLVDSPGRFLELMEANARSIVIVFPFALLGLLAAAAEKRITLYHLSFLLALATLLVVLADKGTDFNHLLDVSVLAVILVGDLWGRATPRTCARGFFPTAILVALVWSVGTGYQTGVRADAIEAVKLLVGRGDRLAVAARPPAGSIQPAGRIFSEDPYVPLALGQRPVVLDAFMLLRIAEKHPDWQDDIVSRLDAQEFVEVVLSRRLDRSRWWRDNHFGIPIVSAIDRNYRLARRVRGWRDLWVYARRSDRVSSRRAVRSPG